MRARRKQTLPQSDPELFSLGRALPLPQVGSSGNDSWHLEESDAAVGREVVWEGL